MPQSPYTPWKPDWKRSWALLYLLPTLLFMTGYALPETRLYALCALILSVWLGWRLRVRVKARRHGQAVEATFVSKAIPALARAGFHVEAGRMTQVGDIDLVVSRPGWAATIEIKSFRYWRGRLRDRKRQQQARTQARRQRLAIGADVAVIWLPNARTNWLARLLNWLLPERSPFVVLGSAQQVVTQLVRISNSG